jgi:hypothetical protein
LVDRREVQIDHPDFASVFEEEDSITIFDMRDGVAIIDLALVVSLQYGGGRAVTPK